MPARIVLASMDDRRESTAVIPHMSCLAVGELSRIGSWREKTNMRSGGARSSTTFPLSLRLTASAEAPDVRDIRVATVQFQHAPGNKDYNLGRVRHFVAEATQAGVEIIAFPEMCLTGYWHVRKLDREAFAGARRTDSRGPVHA